MIFVGYCVVSGWLLNRCLVRQFHVVQLNGLRISIYEKNLETEKKIMPDEQIKKSI